MNYPPNQGGYPPNQGGYPPNQGGYPPFPPNQGGQGFAAPQPGQGPGYPLYPQEGAGFPVPPGNAPPTSYPGINAPPSGSPFSQSAFPSNTGAPYPPQGTGAPYPPQGTGAPYPPQGTGAPYPPQGTGAPYQPQGTGAPYPPQGTGSPYPPQATATSYPGQNLSSSTYPPQGGGSPYPPNPNSYQSGYPQGTNPPMGQGSPYSPPGSPYQTQSSPYPAPGGAPPGGAYPNQQVLSSGAPQSYSQSNYSAGSMWPYTERPTIRPSMNFDPSSDAAILRKAMKGFGTDEASIIQVVGRRTSNERQQIILKYQQSFGRDLLKDMQSELGGNLRSVVSALMTPLALFLAQQLHSAIKGIGTNEKTLIEILCANDNNSLREIKGSYQRTFGKPIEADIRADTSGDFGHLMVAMAAAYRDEGGDPTLAPGLAQTLYQAGAKKLGTDESEFRRILSCYSYPLLRCVFEEYVKVSGGKTFHQAIQSELSGDFKNGMLALYDSINNRASFFARFINESMKGFGTKDDALIRLVISRSEIDMGNIKDEYSKMYGKRLEDAIANDTSGDYKKILLALVQG